MGLAVAPIGTGRPVEELGTLRGGVAWSTIKVPLALAVAARAPTPRDEELIDASLTESDNDASLALWERLGPPEVAASAVQDVLAAAGDSSTRVEANVLRPGFTPFGQTQWSLAAQVRLMAALPGLPHADEIRARMRRVVPEQRWGLGVLGEDVELKGGWGPDPDGRHLVRQMGIAGRSRSRSRRSPPTAASSRARTCSIAWRSGSASRGLPDPRPEAWATRRS